MIEAKGITFAHGEKVLFENQNFIVGKNQKIGLVGTNGAGKSTLLKLIIKEESPNQGSIHTSGVIGYVPQEVTHDRQLDEALSVRSYINPDDQFEDHQMYKLLTGLQFQGDLNAIPKKLSGGQKTKLALARALLLEPDILLLDEPTNFMDVGGKAWVMDFLSRYPKTLIVISHDLALMDRAIQKVLAINPQTKEIEQYTGNYSNYQRLKKEREELLKKQVIVAKAHIKQMEEGLKKMARFNSAKGVRARTRQRRRIEKEKTALPTLPSELRSIKVSLPDPAPVGELPIRAEHIVKSYGEHKVLKDVTFYVGRGERVVLIGHNGAGKSTFLKILTNRVEPDSGRVIQNDDLKVGYYSQEFETFAMDRRLIDVMLEDTHKDERYARALLGRFMFLGQSVFQRIETLSGGEKTRFAIALLTAHNYNLLILDEPTTYLDVMSQRIILEALKDYKGAMIIVSHTPEFLKELTPSRAYMFPDEKMLYWDDSLADLSEEEE